MLLLAGEYGAQRTSVKTVKRCQESRQSRLFRSVIRSVDKLRLREIVQFRVQFSIVLYQCSTLVA